MDFFTSALAVLYVPEKKVFGGNFGMSVSVPVGHVDLAAWTEFAAELRAFLAAPRETIAVVPDLAIADLTEREREVLELVAQGLNNGQLAKRLHISEKTVRNHVSAVLAKLGFQSRSEVIVQAREAGFGRHLTE